MDEALQDVGVTIVRFVQALYVEAFPISTLAIALGPVAMYMSSK
jgi:hypothetical protein